MQNGKSDICSFSARRYNTLYWGVCLFVLKIICLKGACVDLKVRC